MTSSTHLLLLPDRAVWATLRALSGSMMGHGEQRVATGADDTTEWSGAVECLSPLLTRGAFGSTQFGVVISDLWVRHALLPVGKATVADDDAMALAEAHFASLYPATAEGAWPVRINRQGDHLHAAALHPGLLAQLTAVFAQHRARMISLRSLFAHVLLAHAPLIETVRGWLVVDQAGLLIAAHCDHGSVDQLHRQRVDAGHDRGEQLVSMLTRLTARQEAALTQVTVLSDSLSDTPWPTPWRVQVLPLLNARNSPFAHLGSIASPRFAHA